MVNNDLYVTKRAVRAYNLCDRKAYLLIFSPSLSSPNAYEILQAALSNNVRQNYYDSISDQLIVESFSSLSILKAVDILTDVNLSIEIFSIKNETLIKATNILLQDKPHRVVKVLLAGVCANMLIFSTNDCINFSHRQSVDLTRTILGFS